MHLSDIFWQIFGIWEETVFIFDEFLRFYWKISTLNKTKKKKKVKLAISRIFISLHVGWHLCYNHFVS